MASVFAGLPNDIIIKIIKIENRRSIIEENKKNYRRCVKEINVYLNNICWLAWWERDIMGFNIVDDLSRHYGGVSDSIWRPRMCPDFNCVDIANDFVEEIGDTEFHHNILGLIESRKSGESHPTEERWAVDTDTDVIDISWALE